MGDQQEPLGEFDRVGVTAPATQTADLLASTTIASNAAKVRMPACYALLLGFEAPVDLPWQAALVRDADISWISVNNSEPRRLLSPSLVVDSTNTWANTNLDEDSQAS